MNIKLRLLGKDDFSYIWDTYQVAMKGYIEKIWGWDSDWQKKDFVNNIDEYSTYLLVSESEKIGYLQLIDNNTNVYINMLVLESVYQGLGVGEIVLDKVKSAYSTRDIVLKCFKINTRAYRFYINNGFQKVDEEENFFVMVYSGK